MKRHHHREKSFLSCSKYGLLIVFTAFLYLILNSCSSTNVREDSGELRKECENALKNGAFPQLDSLAYLLLMQANEEGNTREKCWAHYFLGTYRPTIDPMPAEQITHLDSAEMLVSSSDFPLLCRLSNTRGLWALRNLNFPVSLIHFDQALAHAKAGGDSRMTLAVESNLTEVYRLMNDTLGFRHSQEIYEKACENDYPEVKASSAFACASYLAEHSNDSVKLAPYLKDLVQSSILRGWDKIFKATFYANQGDFKKADRVMEEMDSVKWQSTYPILLMAKIKSALGEYEESNKLIEAAQETYEVIKQDNRWVELVRLRSINDAAAGEYKEAFNGMERFASLQDSLSKTAAANNAQAWRLKHQVSQKEEKLKSAEERAEKLRVIVIAVILIILIVVIGFCIFYNYRKRHYMRIISQIRDSIILESELRKQQDSLKQQLSRLAPEGAAETIKEEQGDQANQDNIGEKTSGNISKERADEIFSRITKEMEDNRVWTDLNITRESFADRIKVNRTYFSQVIKIKTGLSYTQFMNARRIREAAKILSSSPEDVRLSDLAREVGFLSESSFYTSFRKIMGMKPSDFIKLSKETD